MGSRLYLLSPLPGASPRKPLECNSKAAADIVLLVDGSWSIGRTNFRRVRDFLEGLVTPFHIGPDRVQIGGWLRKWRGRARERPADLCSGVIRG